MEADRIKREDKKLKTKTEVIHTMSMVCMCMPPFTLGGPFPAGQQTNEPLLWPLRISFGLVLRRRSGKNTFACASV